MFRSLRRFPLATVPHTTLLDTAIRRSSHQTKLTSSRCAVQLSFTFSDSDSHNCQHPCTTKWLLTTDNLFRFQLRYHQTHIAFTQLCVRVIVSVNVRCLLNHNKTSGPSNLAKVASNTPPSCDPWVFKSLHPKQDLDPFSCVYTAKPREAVWQTDWIIDRNSPQYMHSTRC